MTLEVRDPTIPSVSVPAGGINLSPFTKTFGLLAAEFRKRARQLNVIEARRQGALAGAKGPVELRKSLKAKDQAFNDAVNQTSVNRLETTLRSQLADLEQKHPDDTQEFERLSTLAIKGLVSEMSKQDPILASALEMRAASYQRSASHRIRNTALQDSRDVGLASIVNLQDSIGQDLQVATNDLLSENPQQQADTVDAIAGHLLRLESVWSMPDPDGTGTLLDADEIAKRRIGTINNLYEHTVSSFIRNHPNPGEVETSLKEGEFRIPALIVDELGGEIDGADAQLNPRDDLPADVFNRLVALARAEQGRRNQDRAGDVTKLRTFAKMHFDAKITELQETGESSVPFTDLMALSMAAGDELKAQQFSARVASEELIAAMSPQVAAESVATTQQRIASMEVKGIDAVEDKRMRDAVIESQNRKVQALNSQPFDYAITTESGQEASQAFVDGSLSEPEYRQFMIGLQNDLAGGMFGFVPSIMRRNEAKELVNQFNQLENFQDMIESMSALQLKFGTGKGLEFALNDLVDAGLPPLSAMLVGMDSRSRESRLLARGITVGRKELENRFPDNFEPDSLDDDINTRMLDVVVAMPPGNDLLLNGMFSAAQLLGRSAVVFDGAKSEDAAAKLAFDAIVSSRWVLESGVLIPVAKSTDQVKAAVTTRGVVEFIELNRNNIDPVLISDDPVVQFDYVEELLESGRFVPDAEDEGLELIDSQGRPVISRDGTKLKAPYELLNEIGENIIVETRAAASIFLDEERIRVRRERKRKRTARELQLEQEEARQTTPLEVIAFLESQNVDVRGKTTAELLAEAKKLQRANRSQ